LGDVNLDATKRKPFDVFAEGRDLKKSRTGWTPPAIFREQVEAWMSHIKMLLVLAA
jgi:hypothetical protein